MNRKILSGLLACVIWFTGCTTATSDGVEYNPYKDREVIVKNEVRIYGPAAPSFHLIEPAAGKEQGLSAVQAVAYDARSVPSHCRLKDRFDRKELIAYNFADGQSRLGLKLDVDGFSLSDAGNFDLEEMKLVFRYRFQKHKKPREKCLYGSSWQGLVGSGYNELYLREEQTVYEELDEEFDDISDKLGKLL